jgi:cell division protein FtsB
MNNRVKPWHVFSFRSIFDRAKAGTSHRRPARRLTKRDVMGWEALEGRVVLSGRGDVLSESLSSVGVMTGPVLVGNSSMGSSGSQTSQGQTDLKSLETELQSLAAKSGVTVADLTQLRTDEQTIASAGFRFDPETLQVVVTELATAVAGGSSTAQAQTDFTALFSGSTVTQSVIDTTFTDLVKVITDSGVTTADLTTVAADEAAVQSDVGSTGNAACFGGPDGLPVGILTQSLTSLGVVTTPITSDDRSVDSSSTDDSSLTQLKTDEQTLATQLQTLSAKSQVTVADLTKLDEDAQTIAQDGYWFEGNNLQSVISELATAVAGGTSTTQAQADFTALFSGSTVPQSAIDTTFNDLVQVIKDSGVTPTDLTTVATDQAAIQADLSSLGIVGSSDNGTGCGPGTNTDSSSTSTSTTSSSSTGTDTSTSTASSNSTTSTTSTTSTGSTTTAATATSPTSVRHHHKVHARLHRRS